MTLHTDSFLWSKLKQLLQKIWAELDCFQIPFFPSIKKAGPNKWLLWKTLLLTTLWCWWAWSNWNPVFREQGMGKCHFVYTSHKNKSSWILQGDRVSPNKELIPQSELKSLMLPGGYFKLSWENYQKPKKTPTHETNWNSWTAGNSSIGEKKAHSSLISGTEGKKSGVFLHILSVCSCLSKLFVLLFLWQPLQDWPL